MEGDPDYNITPIDEHHKYRPTLSLGGGDGTSRGMEARVGHLETRVDRVELKLDTIIEKLGSMASKADMRNYLFTAIGLFVGLMALMVTGLGWLETRETRIQPLPAAVQAPQPIIIQLPAAPRR